MTFSMDRLLLPTEQNYGETLQTETLKISLIIPTLNEEKSIEKVLENVPREIVDEVIVVDSSVDNTANISKRYGAIVIHEPPEGYGSALQAGLNIAMGNIIVYMDGDYTYDPQEIRILVKPIFEGRCNVVLGNRLRNKKCSRSMSVLNRIGNNVISLIFSFLFLKRIHDTQTGFRAIKTSFLAGLKCRESGMPYATEQLIKLLKRGALVCEVPITYRPRLYGNSKLKPLKDGLKITKTMLVSRFSKAAYFSERIYDTQCGLMTTWKRFLDRFTYSDYVVPYVTKQLIRLVKKRSKIGNISMIDRPSIGMTKLCVWKDGFTMLRTFLKGRLA